MTKALEFPEYAWKEGQRRPALEVSIDFLPKQFEGRWLDPVREFTANWVRRKKFSKKATLWMWGCISVNLISRHLQSPVPSWSDFIVQFGLPGSFLDELGEKLRTAFEDQVRSELLLVRRSDGWVPICHIEGNRAWRNEDSPGDWVPIEKPKGSKGSTAGRIRKSRK